MIMHMTIGRRTKGKVLDVAVQAQLSDVAVDGAARELQKYQLGAWRRALLVFISPLAAYAVAICGVFLATMGGLMWSLAVPDADSKMLIEVATTALGHPIWLAASLAVIAESSWVLPAAVAAILGLYAALFALRPSASSELGIARVAARTTATTRRRLVMSGVLVGAVAAFWAWMGVPALVAGHEIGKVAAGLVVAALCALLAGEIGGFSRSWEVELDSTNRRIARLEVRKALLAGHPLNSERVANHLRLLWLFGIPSVATAFQCILLGIANQAGANTILTMNFGISVAALPFVILLSWPLLTKRSGVRVLLSLIQTGVAVALLAVFWRLFDTYVQFSRNASSETKWLFVAFGCSYLVWGAATLLVSAPVVTDIWRRLHKMRGRTQPSDLVLPRRPSLSQFSLASAMRDLFAASTKDSLSMLESKRRALRTLRGQSDRA